MSAESSPSITVFLPFYNEEELVESVVETSIQKLDELDLDFELLLVDDGSTDSTTAKINGLSTRYSRVRSAHHEENQGYGRALATGFKESDGELVFYTDGDGQFDLSELEHFLEELEGYDMVVGYREDRQDSFLRRFTGYGFNRLARAMLPVKEKDIDCAFKLVRKEVVTNIIFETRRTVDAELLAKARKEGYRIKEIPVKHFEREKGESEAEGIIGVRPTLVLKSIEELWTIRRSLN